MRSGELARRFAVSRHNINMQKIVDRRRHEGLINAQRCRDGGFMLGVAPSAISLGRLIRLSEPGLANLDLLTADATATLEGPIWGRSLTREVATLLQWLDAVSLPDALATLA